MPAYPVSPCTKICEINPHSGLCHGCARTLDEIARWSQMSTAEKHKLIADAAARMTELKA